MWRGVPLIALLESAEAFQDATWDDVAPYYEELVGGPLDRTNVEAWLVDWSRFESLLSEAAALANFAYSCNTADGAAEAALLRFGSEIEPGADEQRAKLQRRHVELGYVRPGLETTVRRFRKQMELFSEANVPLFTQLARLSAGWAKVIGAMTVDWDGVEKTPQQMFPLLEDNDRGVRERAFRSMFKPFIEQRDTLAGFFDRMYDLRQQVAKNAGFKNFRDYAHLEKNRFDYTPDDCFRFHEAVEVAVKPAIKRLLEQRRAHMGLDRLRPWDTWVHPNARAPLNPYHSIPHFLSPPRPIFSPLHAHF